MSQIMSIIPAVQIQNDLIQVRLQQYNDPLSLTILAVEADGNFTPLLERSGHADQQRPCFEWVRQGQIETFSDADSQSMALHHPIEQGSYHLHLHLGNSSPWLHVHETVVAEDQSAGISLQRFEAIYHFIDWQEPGEVFSPHLVPEPGDVIGTHVLRSPALTAQCGKRAAALVADVAALHKEGALPAFMNLLRQEHCPQLSIGLGAHQVRDHVYFTADEQPVRSSIFHLSYFLWVSGQAGPGEALQQSRKKLWHDHGAPNLGQRHHAPTFASLAQQIYPQILKDRWLETNYNGEQAGAISLNRAYAGDVWFCTWFNALRTSYGLFLWGRFLQNQDWIKKAMMTRHLILSAPQNQGLFPTLFVFARKPFWVHSHHQGGGPGIYHLFDMSWTVYHLLRWHRDLEPNQPSLDFAKNYGRGILALQGADGSLPSFVDAITYAPVIQVNHEALLKDLSKQPSDDRYIPYMLQHHWTQDRFLSSAEDAASLLCLAELACLLERQDPLRPALVQGAKKIAGFLSETVFPQSRWSDFELYYSCSPKPLSFYDHRSEQWPQNTLCLHLAAAGLLRLYQVTQEQNYLQLAEQALNRLCLYQQVWDPPFLSFDGFGGYGVMNTDGEWNDARQAQFADTHLDFYRVTGEEEQLQRGRAACRAAFTTTFLPINRQVYPCGWWRQPRGQAAENHGHSGFDRLCGVSGFDWGSGSALATAAYFRLHGIE